MTADLEVDTHEVRHAARELSATGARVAAGAQPPPTVMVPRWETSSAAATLAEDARRIASTLATGLEATGHDLLITADGYDGADALAAARLSRATARGR
ncbi:hypothetical protein EV385_3843 [Krasilnikovia cinnamomea]|uniref:Excreted virulence factor EspC (Type VII ESX diderm) n=1 Tax=Krasilnikovia cinnamomea TaxID=349313 RepID=A0A4Q7ZM03_9ACTN|nr:hypothetical protein [Krasilnikovia cinnamomea]RZU52002.1 hypothetical protein EV385_3843 [Krasilnikovia cinnamomea]